MSAARTRTKFEGREVLEHSVSLTGASADGDGTDPHYVGDRVYFVCEAVVEKITHRPLKDSDALARVASARMLIGALVDHALISEAIELARADAEAKEGIQRLGFDEP